MWFQPESAPGRRVLDRAVLAAGALLLVAGLVSFFAFNWALLTSAQKFSLLGGVVTLGALASLWWRDPARQASLFLSFAATGVWLATIGQAYQTGADVWQLFAGWAALGLFWALAAASPLIWVAVLLLVQLAALRFATLHGGALEDLMASLGAGRAVVLPLLLAWSGLVLWEAGWRLRPGLGLRGRTGLRVLAVLILGLSLWLGLEGTLVHFHGLAWAAALASLALLAGHALWLRRDLPLLGFTLIAASLLGVAALGRLIGWHDGMFTSLLLGLVFVGLSSAIVNTLKKLVPAGTAGQAPPWFLSAITGAGAWLGALLMVSFLTSMAVALANLLGGASPAWLLIGVALIAAAWTLFRRTSGLAPQPFALAFSLAGQAALAYGLFRLLGSPELHRGQFLSLILVLIYIVLTVMISHPGHRFFAVKGFWSVLTLLLITLIWPAELDGMRDLRFYLPMLPLTLACLWLLAQVPDPSGHPAPATRPGRFRALRASLTSPAARQGTLVALATGVGVLGLLIPKLAGESLVPAGTAPDTLFRSFGAHQQWSLVTSLMLSGYVAWRFWPLVPAHLRLSLAGGLALATALLWRSPLLFMGLVYVAACWPRGRAGQAIGVLLCLLGFSAFYYDLLWPLWFKALLLAAVGAALLLGRWYWARQASPGARLSFNGRSAGAALAALALAVTLAAALGAIRGKERILTQGQHVFLALAPVDPRSLMQGDYMALRFELAVAIAEREALKGGSDESIDASRRARARGRDGQVWIRLDDRRVAQLAPEGAQGPAEGLLRLQFQRLGGASRDAVQISTNAWFFQEGQGKRFEKARFGEFVVDAAGQALLVGLRDGALVAIAP